MIVRELITRLGYKHDKSGMKSYNRMIDNMPKHARQAATRTEGVFSRFSRRTNKLLQLSMRIHGIGRAKAELSGVERMAKRTVGGLRNIAVAAVAASSAAAAYMGKKTFEATGNKQMLMARLETVLGSRAAAESKYGMMANFAEMTPYKKNELVGGFSTIAGSGYKLTQRDLTALGDVAAGSQKSFGEMIEMLKSANRGLGNMVDNFDGMKAKAEDGMLAMERFDKVTGKWVKKTVEAGDMAGIVAFVREHGERNYKGQMDSMSKTLPGMMSTLQDRISQRFEDIGDAGVDKLFDGMMKRLLKGADDLKPVAKRVGEFVTKWVPKTIDWLKSLKPLIKPVAVGLGFIASYLVGAKVLAGYSVLSGVVGKLILFGRTIIPLLPGLFTFVRTAGFIPMLMGGLSAGLAALLPVLIGGAIAGLVWLGWQLYKYWKDGDAALAKLRDKFPVLADSIKYLGDATKQWWPEIKNAWNLLKGVGGTILNDLKPVAKDLFQNVLIPFLGWTIRRVADFAEGLKIIWDWSMPKIVTAFYYWRDSLAEMKQNFTNFFNYLAEKFPWLAGIVEKIAGFMGRGTDSGLSSGSGDGASFVNGRNLIKSNGKYFQKNNDLASKLTSVGRGIYSGAKQCLRGVWMTQKAVMGTSKITAAYAYQAADQIAKDSRFQEIQVTPEMYRKAMAGDTEMMKLLHGANVIYNRGAGFSSTAGHAEIWDLVNKKALYGLGPKSMVRSEHMLKNARFFIPAQQVAAPSPNYQAGNASGGAGATVPIQQNFYGPANPAQVRNAANQGTTQALNKAGLSARTPARAN